MRQARRLLSGEPLISSEAPQAELIADAPYTQEDVMARMARSYAKPLSRGKKAAQRYCLRCDRQFWSEGAHHRLCQRCRQSIAASPSPVEEYSVVSVIERGLFDAASVGRRWYR